ncbi:MAG: hypothetical protein K2X27_14475 [Candidatus Obscuribacterales bacterium]|nr:hypothetical protein [Candidatus Obscuribacterales bacterium]
MGVGLNLIGQLAAPQELENWFNAVWDWLGKSYPGMASGAGLGKTPDDEYLNVTLRFHPAADPVKLWLSDAQVLHVSAETASAGPGYHLFLCDVFWTMAETFGISWAPEDDESDPDRSNPTFFSKDPEQAYYEMFSWLASMAASASIMSSSGTFRLAMSPSYQFFSEQALITSMGPRSAAWLKEVAKNPGAGADVFPWLKPDAGAEYLLNRALCHMWTDIRWCKPIADGDEILMRNVLFLLKEAYKLDPALNYPWREWAEIMAYAKVEDELSPMVRKNAVAAPISEPIGYRRRELRVMLDQGWSVLIPGSFSESGTFDPATMNHNWQFWNDELMIWFTTYPTYGDASGNIMPVNEAIKELDELQKNLGDFVEEDSSGKVWRRTFMSGDPQKSDSFRFSSILLVPGRLAMTHVFSQKKDDLDSAIGFFKAVDNTAGNSIKYLDQPRWPRVDLVSNN